MKRLLLIIITLAVACSATAQGCYKETLSQGVSELKKQHYTNARNILNAAKDCPDIPKKNSISFWISQCNQGIAPKTRTKINNFSAKLTKYEFAGSGDFFDDLCMVYRKGDDNYTELPKVGFINQNADLIIPCKYLNPDEQIGGGCTYFSEGLAAVAVEDENGYQQRGYIDTKGKIIIPFQYMRAYPFLEGMAGVLSYEDVKGDDENTWFYHFIDTNNATILSGKYIGIGSIDGYNGFNQGVCVVEIETGKWGLIDLKGNFVIPAEYDYMYDNGKGQIIAFKGEECAMFNKSGKQIEDFHFDLQFVNERLLDYSPSLNTYIKKLESQKKWKKLLKVLQQYEKNIVYKLQAGQWRPEIQNNGSKDDMRIAYYLGKCYYLGLGGIEKDADTASNYFSIAKKRIDLLNGIGLTYRDNKEYQKARVCYEECIQQKATFFPALYNLGMLYYYGQGVPLDYKKAMTYFEECAKYGFEENANQMIEKCKAKL